LKSVLEQGLSHEFALNANVFKTYFECAENVQSLHVVKCEFKLRHIPNIWFTVWFFIWAILLHVCVFLSDPVDVTVVVSFSGQLSYHMTKFGFSCLFSVVVSWFIH